MTCPELQNCVFSEHALWEMARRGITKDEVNSVLNAPDQREEIRPGRCVYQSRLTYGEPPKVYLLRVGLLLKICSFFGTPILFF